jgi:hypothetical protein
LDAPDRSQLSARGGHGQERDHGQRWEHASVEGFAFMSPP